MILDLRRDLDRFVAEALPWATVTTKRIIYVPTVPADVKARLAGPDPDVLRALAEKARAILRTATPNLHTEVADWHEREPVVRPVFATDRAQAIGISRADIAIGIDLVTAGSATEILRERDRRIDTALAAIRPAIEAIALPEGNALEWGGQHESATQAQAALGRQMPISFGTMLLITVLLSGTLRQTAVIWTIVPMAVNGAASGPRSPACRSASRPSSAS